MRVGRRSHVRVRRRSNGSLQSARERVRLAISERAGFSLEGAPPELLQALDEIMGRLVRAVIVRAIEGGPEPDVQGLLAARLRERLDRLLANE